MTKIGGGLVSSDGGGFSVLGPGQPRLLTSLAAVHITICHNFFCGIPKSVNHTWVVCPSVGQSVYPSIDKLYLYTLTYGLWWRHEDRPLLRFIIHEGSLSGRGRCRKYLTVHEIGRLALLSLWPSLRRGFKMSINFLGENVDFLYTILSRALHTV